MPRVATLAAAVVVALAGGCRTDAPGEPWLRRDPPGPFGRLADWPLPGNFPVFDRYELRDGGTYWSTLDLDGDGRPDLVLTGVEDRQAAGPSPWVFHRNTGSRFAAARDWPVPAGGYAGGRGFLTADFQTQGSADGTGIWRTVDLDGDRRPDLVITGVQEGVTRQVPGGAEGAHWLVHRNLGDGFAAAPEAWPLDAAAANVTRGIADLGPTLSDDNERRGHLVDLDGDGRLDLVATTEGEGPFFPGDREVPGFDEGEPHWRFLRNTGTGFAPAAGWPVPDRNRGAELLGGLHALEADDLGLGGVAWTLADLDGDRRPDLLITSAPGTPAVPGLDAGEPHWEMFRNTGSGFAATPVRVPVPALEVRLGAVGPYSIASEHGLWWALLDFDGDGRPDLLATAVAGESADTTAGFPEAQTWTLYRNEGAGFARDGVPVGLPDGGLDTGGFVGIAARNVKDRATPAVHSWRTIDVDGDGRVDLVWILARSGAPPAGPQVIGLPAEPRWLVSFQR